MEKHKGPETQGDRGTYPMSHSKQAGTGIQKVTFCHGYPLAYTLKISDVGFHGKKSSFITKPFFEVEIRSISHVKLKVKEQMWRWA